MKQRVASSVTVSHSGTAKPNSIFLKRQVVQTIMQDPRLVLLYPSNVLLLCRRFRVDVLVRAGRRSMWNLCAIPLQQTSESN